MQEDYKNAKKLGDKEVRKAVLNGRYPYLSALDSILGDKVNALSTKNLGIVEIPLDAIVGTKTEGRQNAFSYNFMPIMELKSEFANKWLHVLDYQEEMGISDPIKVYEYLKKFYVEEGNKRVSVMKYLSMPSCDAEVIRILPMKSKEPEIELYYEFLDFYKVCPVYNITFTRLGSYRTFLKQLGLENKTHCTSDEVHAIEGIYYRFSTLIKETQEDFESIGITMGDALLIYLSVYTASSLLDQPRPVLEKRLKRMSEEFISLAHEEEIHYAKTPTKAQNTNSLFNWFSFAKEYSEANPLKVAFLYESSPEKSAWSSDLDTGRIFLENKFEGIVEASYYANCNTPDTVEASLQKAILEKNAYIFTTSPAMMPQTLKASIDEPSIHFLNSSINLSHRTVRTYYPRLYECKFILGALAASLCDNHKVGYLADHPIYGNIADINAFALGAAYSDPACKVYLQWTSKGNADWHTVMKENEVRVISGPDVPQTTVDDLDVLQHGIFLMEEDETVVNIASPIYNWGIYYELILKTVLNGTYDDELKKQNEKALNYWYGLKEGVTDIKLSDRLSYYSFKFVDVLKQSILEGTCNPFRGEIHSQSGIVNKDGQLSDAQIIQMDWLNDNVIGSIPSKEELTPAVQELVKVAGVKEKKVKVKQ